MFETVLSCNGLEIKGFFKMEASLVSLLSNEVRKAKLPLAATEFYWLGDTRNFDLGSVGRRSMLGLDFLSNMLSFFACLGDSTPDETLDEWLLLNI